MTTVYRTLIAPLRSSHSWPCVLATCKCVVNDFIVLFELDSNKTVLPWVVLRINVQAPA